MEGYRLLRLDDDMVTASHGRVPRYASGARFALRYSGVKVRVLEVLVASSLGLAVVKSCGKEGALGDRRWPVKQFFGTFVPRKIYLLPLILKRTASASYIRILDRVTVFPCARGIALESSLYRTHTPYVLMSFYIVTLA
jgi:hypothetical protein